jgi:hypothetical protein
MKALAVLIAVCSVSAAGIDVLDAGSGGCRLLLGLDSPEVLSADSSWYLFVAGAGLRSVPGEAVIPDLRLYVPVPPGTAPGLSWNALRREPLVLPASQVLRAPELTGTGLETVEVQVPPSGGPTAQVALAGVYTIAGCWFAAIDVYPWLPASGGTFLRELEIQVSWPATPGSVEPAALASLLAPEGCRVWRSAPGGGVRDDIFWGRPWARLAIGESGAYEVSCEQLSSAGCEIEGSPSSTLRLFSGPGVQFATSPSAEHQLEEQAFEVLDGGDGSFDQGDRIRFVARGLNRWEPGEGQSLRVRHRFAECNVYWLTWGAEDGLRLVQQDASPDGSAAYGPTCASDLWLEENNEWHPYFEMATGWIWAVLAPGTEQQAPYALPAAGSGESSVTVSVVSDTALSLTLELWIGGTLIGSDTWTGGGSHILEVAGVALPASGTVRVINSDLSEADFSLDWIHIEYPMQLSGCAGQEVRAGISGAGRYTFTAGPTTGGTQFFDLTDPYSPVRLTGVQIAGSTATFSRAITQDSRLLAVPADGWIQPDSVTSSQPGRLAGTVTGADRLIIAPENFLDAVWGLVAIYEARGVSCEVATTREIYDEFGQGVTDPGAIRSAVRWALDYWDPQVQGVVLVGDGHYDFLGRTTTLPIAIPPWEELGPADRCFDDYYVMVHDASAAELPELPISRIPVDSRAELLSYLAKLLECESGENSGSWMHRALLIADDEWGQQEWKNETEHTLSCEAMADSVIPALYDRRKFYLIEYPWPTSAASHPEKPEAREALVGTLCEGFGFVAYFGHGSAGQIAHEKVFLRGDVDRLTNGSRLPLFIFGTCDVGRFDTPGEDAIGERLMTYPVGGGIACIAASRGTYGAPNLSLARSVAESLYTNPGMTGGQALWLAKLTQTSYENNNIYYIYFGDLDTRIYTPDGEFPMSVATDTLWTGESNEISGSGLPDEGIALLELRESAAWVDYTCLGGAIIHWLRYGGAAFRGSAAIEGGIFSIPCFVPVQAALGDLGRAQSATPSPGDVLIAGLEPVPVAEGTPAGDDFTGPDAILWIDGYEGIEAPQVSGEIQLEADLSDSSGICFLGGQGRALMLFVDGQGTDVGAWFSYNQGSTTSGHLSYLMGQLSEGTHDLILWSIDGLGNGSQDTLTVEAGAPSGIGLSEALVYPNPGHGLRCFSFQVSEDASVTVGIYTLAGRCIRRLTAACGQGYNQILWDGLDTDGDIPASGAYIYRIEAVTSGQSGFEVTAVETGVVAQIRED